MNVIIPPLKLIQKRIANISIGPSTLRGQPKGSIKIAIAFLKNLDLHDFINIDDETDFLGNLDKQTNLLKDKLPSKSWGVARKALNIFLFQATHDIYLSKEYNLRKLIPYLELPLDNPNGKRLDDKAKQKNRSIGWHNIKNLTKENSDMLQNFAKELAREEYNCERCYLDIYFWRGQN